MRAGDRIAVPAPSPSRDSLVFAGFLITVAAAVSYLHIEAATTLVTFAVGAASFLIGYQMGLPVRLQAGPP